MMDKVKIVGLGYSNPPYCYDQKIIFNSLGYSHHFWKIFEDSKIEHRYFSVPLDELKELSFQHQQEQYSEWAFKLSAEAMERTISTGEMKEIGLLSFSSCTGFAPGPTVGHFLADRFHLQDVEICNLSGLGCEGSFPGLRRCYDYTKVTGKPSVAIACELSSLGYFPEYFGKPDPENDYELLRAAAIFGDGCSVALIGSDDNPNHPEILDFATVMDTSYLGKLGFVWRNGRLRVRLSKDVPKIAVELATRAILKLLGRNSLMVPDISYWIFHPPGAIVLDKLQEYFHLTDDNMKYSRQVLTEMGNCSSSTVGIVGAYLMRDEPNPQGYAIMVNVGPGMVSNVCLMQFGN